MKYRPEIDGLRAVAVVPVILFHAGFGAMSGGFVGVDVFFVISGYLITTILLGEQAAGRFSILRFYERRARRILPALFAVLLVCLPFAWAWMIPSALVQFCYSLAATVLFVSNLYFLDSAGYFATGTEFAPLLHTWSLAVEEQYYLMFPPLLMALAWLSRRWLLVCLGAFALASLGVAEWGWRAYPAENFFFTLSRLWELLAGSICAVAMFGRTPRGNGALGALGLALIVGSALVYDAGTPFPSLYTLAPVGGTVLIIAYGVRGTAVARLLSLRAFTAIGVISYSAYLWHQPLFAFARVRSLHEPSVWLMMALALATFPLAWLSWRYVEQPFRDRGAPLLPRRGQVFGTSAAVGVALFGFGLVGHLSNGLPGRLPARVVALDSFEKDRNPYTRRCQFRDKRLAANHPVEGCDDFLINRRAEVVFIGDSHSGAVSHMAQKHLMAAGISSYAYESPGCIALPGFKRNGSLACDRYNRMMRQVAHDLGASTIVLTSRFTLHATGERFDNGEGGVENGTPAETDTIPGQALSRGGGNRKAKVLAEMEAQIRASTKEFNVILVHPIPEAGWHVPRTRAKRALFAPDMTEPLSTSYARYKERNADVLSLFNALTLPGLHHVRPVDVFCDTRPPGRCENARDGKALYFDDDHPSTAGAVLLAPLIVDRVQAALAAPP
ncbi:acyltransferase family protein [Sediminimonas sp.]|uniref:acyltransferase family protein n=1 Tax=Sediminimonas sp. TaxID=2823379 RepID=UPI0026001847|nr:acyltransferase family protein [Sediminimonas sp.]